jgi:ribosomal protein S18 acetylase RimI-like enzyme
MPPTIRRAAPADAAVLADFNTRMAAESEGTTLPPATIAAGVAAILADPAKGVYYVAEHAGEVVGQLLITYEYSDWRDGWLWWIQSVYVRPDHRRQGVFRALYRHVETQARADPTVAGLRLYVEQENNAARQTYERLGMHQTRYLVMEMSLKS